MSPTRKPAIRLAPLVAIAVTLCVRPATAGPGADPGRLLNLAQQQLTRGEIEPAIASLEQVLDARPQEGFAWGLLAEALVWGRAEGAELVASWEAHAAARPDDGFAQLRVVRAHMALHRRDKFTSATTDWVVQSEERIRPYLAARQPKPLQFAAHVVLRDLLYRTGRPSEALAEGVAAWTVDPAPLQGRISRLQWSLQQGDLEGTERACLSILESDPWAVEACGGLFSFDGWSQPADQVQAARDRVLRQVRGLEARGLEDLVLGNELAKFWDRAGDKAAGAEWLRKLTAVDRGFRLADNTRWWRGTFSVPPEGAKLFADTNRANNTPDPIQRLAQLLAIEPGPADDDGSSMAQRWRWRVTEAALAADPPNRVEARARLERIVAHDASDARAWMVLAEQSGPDEARIALRAAESAVFRADWDPWERYGSLTFPEVQERRAMFVADLRLRRARVEREAGDVAAAWALALDAAWSGPHLPEAWALVAELAAASGRSDYARDADISWLAGLISQGEEPDAAEAEDAIARYRDAHPEATDTAAAWVGLLAAARSRANVLQTDEVGPPPTEVHPLVGEAAPPLTALDLTGGERSLDELRGRVVVVDFWATWCAPCKRALPELQAAADGLADQPVTFLLVSVDAELETARRFLAESSYGMDPVWAPDGKEAQGDWVVKGIPSTFVVDREGIVRFHHQGYERGGGERISSEVRDLLR
jgi:thiol-disulfide isomerase/thioredoxin/tetratricopeptide (TPR) repeat protein